MNTQAEHTGTDFRHHKETSLIHKQSIRLVINYSSSSWTSSLSNIHLNTPQTIQKKALRIITGCTLGTPIEHRHTEVKMLKIK